MKDQHTLGPWKTLLSKEPNIHSGETEDRLVVSVNGGEHICEVFRYRGHTAKDILTVVANARLIEVAPDMKVLLRECAKALLSSSLPRKIEAAANVDAFFDSLDNPKEKP